MKSRVIWISAGLLLLVVILSMGVVAEKGPASPVFGDSLIQPTHEEVHVGDALGFTIYVVNSGDVTATDVLVWNPIPAGAEFLSVSGGAFPVVGGPITGAISPTPPEGYAYNTRSRMVVPLEEDSDVTGIAWVGD
ncbi:MAG TPA: DUF11 domain-containing protein, partial [Anaerolineae bacterium]|nr:DUF11 domain-containing protein [Anaerolineae bacterium]